ncbi:MAG: transglycosylase SLT domain-containing protein [Polyangiaceae bacterium]|nr:transglycosylase SLT domain-containing protein [Polyangiaceae bacterium]
MCTPRTSHSKRPAGPYGAQKIACVHIATVALLLTVGQGCAEKHALGPPPSESTARVTSAAPTAAPTVEPTAAPTPPPAERSWVEAVRLERWTEAAAKIDALPAAERARPEVQYVRARAALHSGEPQKARELLTGLEQNLPDLQGDIARYRAEAAVDAGPYADAVVYFSKSAKPRDLARAVTALERSGDLAGARKTAERAVTIAQKGRSRAAEATARAARARVASGGPESPAAIADLRWIVVFAPGEPEGLAAREVLDRLKIKLTANEVAQRIDALLDAARGEDAVAEAFGPDAALLPQKDRLHLRGMALYKARRYTEAAEALQKAANSNTGREAEELHYAARALARAERDTDAITKHREVARRFRTTPWGDRSAFMAAQLLALTGQYDEAAKAFTAYLGAFPRGERKDDAEYERALALLSGKNPLSSRQIFAKLGDDSKRDDTPRLLELEGVAAFRGGQREVAIRLWNKVIRTMPLSWSWAMARARLVQAGEPVPPLDLPSSVGGMPLDTPLPKPAALLASVGLDADAESWLTANEQAAAAPFPGRESEALCSMYSKLSRAKRRYRLGTAAVSYTSLMRTPGVAERWTWDCVYPSPYAEHVRKTEEANKLPLGLVHAVMRQESAFDPVIASPAGAVGLLQIIPPTAKAIAREIDPNVPTVEPLSNPEVSVRYGGYYLSKLLGMFQNSVPLAAAAYNAGPKIVSHWLAGAKDLDADVWVARIPYEETRNYVARVSGNLLRYEWLAGGNDKVIDLPLKLPENARAPADAY